MGLLRKLIICLAAGLVASYAPCLAQESSFEDYNRCSLYSFSIVNTGTTFSSQVIDAMLSMQHPERYNDHDLSARVLQSYGDPDTRDYRTAVIDKFLNDNQIAKRMVSKWFNRDKLSGAFDMSLIQDRGKYNASAEDVILANHTIRGEAMLADAGEQLIGNTFVIVNEISYIDKELKNMKIAAVFQGIASVASIAGSASSLSGSSAGKTVSAISNAVAGSSSIAGGISDNIAGFTVKIHSYLYRLVWDDEVAAKFYNDYYYDSLQPNQARKTAYMRDLTTFKLRYVGDFVSKSSKAVLKGLHDDSEVFNKVLWRTIDENIVQLQNKFPEFHVRAGIFEVTPEEVHIHIGLKEGLTAGSKYEVLERREKENGEISYHRVAMLSPDRGKIWDNRHYAAEEEADNAGLEYSTFVVTSGDISDITPGMLVREVR